jgi:PAS domain S-box-containing protein
LEAIMSQLRLIESIVHHIPAAIAYRDRDTTLRWVNPAYLRLLGLPAERVLNRTFPESFPEAAEHFMPLLERLVATRQPVEVLGKAFDYEVDGVTRHSHWDISYVPVIGEGGEVEGTLSLGIEVSSRIESERLRQATMDQLQAIDRYKDEFLSIISHELRTPLNFITASASMLEDGVSGPLTEPQLENVRRIMGGSERMLVLVEDLLDAAQLQAGRFDMHPRPTPYAPLVEEIVRQHTPFAEHKGTALTWELHLSATPVLDPMRIGQVLSNLLTNAIKFTPSGGRVTVRATERGDSLITELDVPRLFTRFGQLDMSATRPAGGTGLGLAISRSIVEAHGGMIGVRSTPGQGSTFWVSLPLRPPS